jgi:arylsulfatase A-like enzyme
MITRRSFLAASAVPLFAKKKEAAPKPNVLIIVAEDVGAWMLGCYGNTEIRTPNIDLLARTGVRFSNSFAAAPVASASRPQLLAGYAGGDSASGTQQALDYLDRQKKGSPFFLSVNYTALDGGKRAADYKDVRFETIGWERPAPNAAAGKEFLKDTVASIRRVAASVTTLDDQVQLLINRLQQRGLRDDTLVVFTSAAGQLLGRHGLWGDGLGSTPVNMFDEVMLVPMLWSWHGKTAPELVRAEVISARDLASSLYEATGAAKPSNLAGNSYFRLAANIPLKKKETWPATVFARYQNVGMARDSRYKLVIRDKGEGLNELYDVRVDTREKINQYENPGFITVRDRLRRALDAQK